MKMLVLLNSEMTFSLVFNGIRSMFLLKKKKKQYWNNFQEKNLNTFNLQINFFK